MAEHLDPAGLHGPVGRGGGIGHRPGQPGHAGQPVQLPAGDDQTLLLNLIVYIRDLADCITEYNLSSITVVPDSAGINDLVNNIQSLSKGLANNPIVQLLASGNQNTVGQIITSISQQFNKMNNENVNNAVSSKLYFIINN